MTSYADFHCLLPAILATLFATLVKVPNILRIFGTLSFDVSCHQGKLSIKTSTNFLCKCWEEVFLFYLL